MPKITKKRKIKHLSLKALHKRAWKLQSEYIRRISGRCFTCGVKKPWKELDLGHYIHLNALDFDIINLAAQCTYCNRWKHGNSGIFAERLIAEYGEQAIAELRVRSQQVKKFTIGDLQTIIAIYQQKLAVLQKAEN